MKNSENPYLRIMEKNQDVPEELIRCLKSDLKIVLYGAGNQGVVCEETLVNALHFHVEAILRSDEYAGTKRYSQLPGYILSESPYSPQEVYVIIALNQKDTEIVYHNLLEKNYENIYCCEDWEPVNMALREIRFQAMLEKHKLTVDKSGDYIQLNKFKFHNPWKEKNNYLSFFLGEFGELVAPHVFADLGFLRTEGPYCYHNVDIKQGDIILDLGANIGLFSAAAAAIRAEKIYAFEPVKYIAEYLQKTADLYGGTIEIERKAVSDRDGWISFYEVEEGFHDIGESTIHERKNKHWKEKKVQAISIDSFVEEKKLERLDFIKADIEGAERYMLMGAKNTLKNFAPKLALCTYHLPDDKEVMTKLILEANPQYVIEYQWEKLYAYVPSKDLKNSGRN